jgi:hypothetical protein
MGDEIEMMFSSICFSVIFIACAFCIYKLVNVKMLIVNRLSAA